MTEPQMSAASAMSGRAPVAGLGDRVRALRQAAGLTQTALAGGRVSKEYVSQIERGKTRPTAETVAWLAERLRVDVAFLDTGVSADARVQVEAILARAEALSESHRYEDAVAAFGQARGLLHGVVAPELEVRALAGEGWAQMQHGDVRGALETLQVARALSESPRFSDIDRADVLFRLGCCRYKLSSVASAVGRNAADAARDAQGCLRTAVMAGRGQYRHMQRALPAGLLPGVYAQYDCQDGEDGDEVRDWLVARNWYLLRASRSTVFILGVGIVSAAFQEGRDDVQAFIPQLERALGDMTIDADRLCRKAGLEA